MSGRDYVNPNQLKMFYTGQEMTQQFQPGEGDRSILRAEARHETDDEVWARKLSEAGRFSEYEDAARVADEPVAKPVDVVLEHGKSGKPQVLDGHHRVAVRAAHRPNEYVPVLHAEDEDGWWDAAPHYDHSNPF